MIVYRCDRCGKISEDKDFLRKIELVGGTATSEALGEFCNGCREEIKRYAKTPPVREVAMTHLSVA